MITGPVHVRQHRADRHHSVLCSVILCELQPYNLRESISFVRWLERPREQLVLPHGLAVIEWVDARRAEEQILLGSETMARRKQVQGHPKVLVRESHRIANVSRYPSHLGRYHQDVIGAMLEEVAYDARFLEKVQLVTRWSQHVTESGGLQQAASSATDHSRTACD